MITTTTTNSPRLAGVLGGLVSLALVTACPSPVGSTTDSDGSTTDGSTSTTGTTNQTATVTITTTSATDPTTGSTSSPTTGDPICPVSDGFSCVGGYDCGESCGEFASRFDDEGCVRPSCSSDGDCGEGEVCYGANWGLCTSSQYNCADESGSCGCDSTDDCGGNYCVPTSTLPGSAIPLDRFRLDNDCGPDDGPAVKLEIDQGEDEAVCKTQFSEPWLRLTATEMGGPLEPGTYPLPQGESSSGDAYGGGWLTIDTWEGGYASGSYAAIFGDALFEGAFVDAEFCGTEAQCG